MVYDKAVDQNKATEYDLTPDQKKEVRKYRQAERKAEGYKFTKRERKPNEEKRELIIAFQSLLGEIADENSINLTNPERQIDFLLNGTKYRIVLSAPRS